ncbi:LAME_0E10220g1_1 [Lachancea meyersii CBS 8951]|uniref:LAME_0E10220g1_1 n=1 Tax=Lachancea meyersii CBS 8951 TaxID=1266667 RepID=A0A1G4JJX0_9SACH|nr:LAME_0E10220g1_1 [Lachancea meyersii CBS 8951]
MSVLHSIPLFLNCIAILYQRRYNRLHKSVSGLSYDLYVLSFASYVLNVYCGLNYLCSGLVRKQLVRRFPVYFQRKVADIPVSTAILVADLLNLISTGAIIKQLVNYRRTKREYQSISYICISILAVCLIFCVFTHACASFNLPSRDSGRFGVYYLEHINYSWVLATLLSGVRLVPQVSVNFMGRSTQGLSSKFMLLSIASAVIQIVIEMCTHARSHPFTPLNGKPIYEPALHLIFLLIVSYQVHKVYRNKAGTSANSLALRVL